MPDLPLLRGGPNETAWTTLVAPAALNTKASSWTTVLASTSYETGWLLVIINAATVLGSVVFDLGVGAAGSEQILIADLMVRTNGSLTQQADATYLFPVSVPRGTRISARAQSNGASAQITLNVTCLAAGIGFEPGEIRVETAGFLAATSLGTQLPDPGGVAHTDGAWGQIIASTGFAYHWLCVSLTTDATTLSGRAQSLVDLAVGASGQEQEVIGDLFALGNTADDTIRPGAMCFPVAIAKGSRLSGRHRCSSIVAGDRRVSLITYGVG